MPARRPNYRTVWILLCLLAVFPLGCKKEGATSKNKNYSDSRYWVLRMSEAQGVSPFSGSQKFSWTIFGVKWVEEEIEISADIMDKDLDSDDRLSEAKGTLPAGIGAFTIKATGWLVCEDGEVYGPMGKWVEVLDILDGSTERVENIYRSDERTPRIYLQINGHASIKREIACR